MKAIYVLDETDEKIIELLCQGYSPKEISHKIWKSRHSVRKRLQNLREKNDCKTTIQLIAKLSGNEINQQG